MDLRPWIRWIVVEHERFRKAQGVLAFADALLLDACAAGALPSDLAALADRPLLEGARRLHAVLTCRGEGFDLPFGTAVRPVRPGAVEIAGDVYAGRQHVPGLHPGALVPREVEGPEFDYLVSQLSFLTRSLRCEDLGLPSPAVVSLGRVQRVLEFPPFPEAGGAALSFDVTEVDAIAFRAAPDVSLERFANAISKGMQAFWRRRRHIAARVGDVRAAALAGLEKRGPDGWITGLARICVDARTVADPNGPTLRVIYRGRDEALREGALMDVVSGGEDVGGERMLRMHPTHARRHREHYSLLGHRADGRIDGRAAAIVRAAEDGQVAVLERLSRLMETIVVVTGAPVPFHAVLFWQDGVICADPGTSGKAATAWRDPSIWPPWPGGRPRAGACRQGTGGRCRAPRLPFDEWRGDVPDAWPPEVPAVDLERPHLLVNTSRGEIWEEPSPVPS